MQKTEVFFLPKNINVDMVWLSTFCNMLANNNRLKTAVLPLNESVFYVSLANGRAALTLALSSNETLSDTAENLCSYIINARGVS